MNLLSLDIRMLRSLISVVDTGSITETARQLGRTQPAISSANSAARRNHRKSAVSPRRSPHAFDVGRRHGAWPTPGRSCDCMTSCFRGLSSPEVQGHVVLGAPDLYASYMLPSVLSIFREAFPRIRVELRCAFSTPTVERVRRGEVDVALVTRMNDFTRGLVVHQEQLVWMVGENSRAQFENPVPARAPSSREYLSRVRN